MSRWSISTSESISVTVTWGHLRVHTWEEISGVQEHNTMLSVPRPHCLVSFCISVLTVATKLGYGLRAGQSLYSLTSMVIQLHYRTSILERCFHLVPSSWQLWRTLVLPFPSSACWSPWSHTQLPSEQRKCVTIRNRTARWDCHLHCSDNDVICGPEWSC